jgi:hypothetical protein
MTRNLKKKFPLPQNAHGKNTRTFDEFTNQQRKQVLDQKIEQMRSRMKRVFVWNKVAVMKYLTPTKKKNETKLS